MSSPAREPSHEVLGVAARVERLYAEHARLVRSVCRNLLRNRTEAEDAVQQTFLSAQRALANGSVPQDPAAWLATIARNECLARVRGRMREPLPVDAETTDVGADAHTVAMRRHEVGELRHALADLPAQQRDAILLRELRGLSYEEVASTLSVTTSAVESLIFRARRTLQTRLREALAAFSPGELAARLLGSGGSLAAPAAAKVVALGIGAAVVTGGAVLGPSEIGLGHAPQLRPAAVAKPSSHRRRVAVPTPLSRRPTAIWVAPTRPAAQDVVQREPSDTSSSGGTEPSDRSTTSSGTTESERTGTSGGTSTQSTETTSSGPTDGGDATQTSTPTQTTSSDAGSLTTDSPTPSDLTSTVESSGTGD